MAAERFHFTGDLSAHIGDRCPLDREKNAGNSSVP